jgi:hypothetical protein
MGIIWKKKKPGRRKKKRKISLDINRLSHGRAKLATVHLLR